MISIIVPVYNSGKTLKNLCMEIIEVMGIMQQNYEIILVNDASRDNSCHVIKKLASNHMHIIGIHLAKNVGQQNALLCGIRYSTGDYVITIDDDLQYTPFDIPKLLHKIHQGYDVVYGIPIQKEHNVYRNIGTRFKHNVFNHFLKKPEHICITSFRILSKRLVDKIIMDNNSFVYLSAATFKNTQNVANVKVHHYKRAYGQSNYSIPKLFKLMFNILIYYSDWVLFKPLKKHKHQYHIKEIIIN
ncbi:MAG: glycosyltransferase [Firmicutes bacterium HGW-Firmicutes-7]|nr:MAG: glycosyltransferase [Firmicutes bacterium HGW-Firmicutes-7]